MRALRAIHNAASFGLGCVAYFLLMELWTDHFTLMHWWLDNERVILADAFVMVWLLLITSGGLITAKAVDAVAAKDARRALALLAE